MQKCVRRTLCLLFNISVSVGLSKVSNNIQALLLPSTFYSYGSLMQKTYWKILLLIYRKFLERSDMKTHYILAVFSRNKAGFPRLNIEKISNNNVKLNRFLKKEPRIVIQNNCRFFFLYRFPVFAVLGQQYPLSSLTWTLSPCFNNGI